ncbi:MAG TPA: SBBP repeat-containing protein [Pyrinomonadaceae bacterium]|nr:SBBP repeat-containing protein [Pyrinomonadaceae bacterium]
MRSVAPRPALARLSKTLLATLAAGLLVAAAVSSRRAPEPPAGGADAKAAASQAREAYGRIPLSFEANQGQAEGPADFLARGAGYSLFLRATEAVFALRVHEGDAARDSQLKVLRMRLEGADDSARAEGADELEGKANYLVGDDPSRWRTNVPTFGSVHYRGVYPGVDLVYYGNQRQLEYDFRVGPGADPRLVSLRFEGADSVEVNADGDLLLALGGSVVRQPKPFVYQEVAGERREVEGGYAVGADGRVGFRLGAYDASLPLVIDPVIVYSTYLGGSNSDQANGVAVDSAGNVYVAGFTGSTDFPTANALQAANGGFQDAFVAKINPAGTGFVYSTYFGGDAQEQARGLAIDSAGNAYITGQTGSTNFPTLNPVQATKGATNEDAFLTKLNPTGTALVYSTYLGGGESSEFGQAVAVDSAGHAYVTGITFSDDFPTLNPIQATMGGGSVDAYLAKFNPAGNALIYSTYLGGSANDNGFGVAADSAGNAYVVGDTESTNFPTANAIQAANAGGRDAFVAKVNATGVFIFSTYLGGSGDIDVAQAVAVDSAGRPVVAGQTNSTNFPTANAFQGANGGGVLQDAFLTKLSADGSAYVYSTYFGGAGGEIAFGVAVDSAGNTYIAGTTASTNTLPTANALQCVRAGGQDVFVAKFNAAASALVYSTYYGGSDDDNGRMVAVDSAGNAYVTGMTFSTNFPTVAPIQSAFAGGSGFAGDAFLFKLSDATTGPASALAFTQTAPSVQEDVTSLTLTVQRTGDPSGPVTVDYATANGTASERSDYTTAVGTLRFAAGETAKTIDILVNEDSYVEGTETFTVALSNATGGATLSCPTSVATVSINDDATEPAANPIDDSTIFVGQHYHDFLNRQSDPSGLAHWTNTIEECGSDAQCREVRRINVSAAFFLSIEFQQTGYLVYRFYKETFTDSPARPRGMPRYREFLRDTQRVGRGVIVLAPGWEEQLEANKQEFAREWVQRPEFAAQFPVTMSAEAFVDKLFQNAETTPTAGERAAAIAAYGAGGTEGRAAALRNVADSGSVYNRQFNSGFILSQYIGYLRRNPNDAPEPNLDYAGFDHWLTKLNGFSQPGDDVRDTNVAFVRISRSEMIKAFIASIEYRQRFGQ